MLLRQAHESLIKMRIRIARIQYFHAFVFICCLHVFFSDWIVAKTHAWRNAVELIWNFDGVSGVVYKLKSNYPPFFNEKNSKTSKTRFYATGLKRLRAYKFSVSISSTPYVCSESVCFSFDLAF